MTAEPAFEQLAAMVADVLGVPVALLSLEEREDCNVVGACGVPSGPRPRGATFCGYTILGQPVVVPDAREDPRFRDSAAVLGPPFIRFSAGVPVRALGQPVGALSILDPEPRAIGGRDLQRLERFARVAEDITELRLGSVRNAVAERRLQSFVESTPVALAVYDRQDRLALSNGKWREAFLGSADEVAAPGTPFRDLLDRIDRTGRSYWVEGQTGDGRDRRTELRRSGQGSYYLKIDDSQWLLCNETVTEAGELIVAFTNATAAKDREIATEGQAELLRTTLENIDQGLALFDADLNLVACSQAYLDLFGHPPGLRRRGISMDTPMHDLGAPNELGGQPAEAAMAGLRAILAERVTQRFEMRLSCGRILSTSVAVLGDGRVVVTCVDITARREVERLKDEFVSTVSHELRTPLTSITGSLGLMAAGAGGALSPQVERLVGIAHRNAGRLNRLVNDLLDIDKVESGQMQFERARLDLNALALQAVEQIQPLASRVQVTVEALVAPGEIVVEGDANHLLQVISNLVSNAVKYSAPRQTVTAEVARRDGRACLSVTDRGPGIPEEFRAPMFRRLSQADASDRRSQEGTGLGLAIALAIAQRHHHLRDRPGAGHALRPRASARPAGARPPAQREPASRPRLPRRRRGRRHGPRRAGSFGPRGRALPRPRGCPRARARQALRGAGHRPAPPRWRRARACPPSARPARSRGAGGGRDRLLPGPPP